MFTRITRNTGEPSLRLAATVTVIGLTIGFAMTGIATAGEQEGVVVRYQAADLDALGTAGELYRRLEAAAASVCTTPGRVPLARMRAEAGCTAAALEQAVATIDDPLLSRIHADRDNETQLAGE